MTAPNENELLETARRLLRESELGQDEFTVARLRAARLRALEAKPRPWLPSMRWLGSVVAAGAVAMLAGVIWLNTPSDVTLPRANDSTVVADIDLLTAKETPEFYTELEFYDWLESDADAS